MLNKISKLFSNRRGLADGPAETSPEVNLLGYGWDDDDGLDRDDNEVVGYSRDPEAEDRRAHVERLARISHLKGVGIWPSGVKIQKQ